MVHSHGRQVGVGCGQEASVAIHLGVAPGLPEGPQSVAAGSPRREIGNGTGEPDLMIQAHKSPFPRALLAAQTSAMQHTCMRAT